ncbi:MAG: hypothetical protein ACI8RD_003354, partial [Bacillariaceae sp.]
RDKNQDIQSDHEASSRLKMGYVGYLRRMKIHCLFF